MPNTEHDEGRFERSRSEGEPSGYAPGDEVSFKTERVPCLVCHQVTGHAEDCGLVAALRAPVRRHSPRKEGP